MARSSRSPMVRTLALLRQQGYYPWKTESYNSFSGRRNDLYRIIDLIFLTPDNTVGVQVCGADFSPHVKKLLDEESFNTRFWLRTKGNELILIGWRKLKHKRGGKLMVMTPRISFITMDKGRNLILTEVGYTWLRNRKRKINKKK